jgi:hypothetical protein
MNGNDTAHNNVDDDPVCVLTHQLVGLTGGMSSSLNTLLQNTDK